MKKFFRRFLIFLTFLVVIVGGIFLFKASILKMLGNYLIHEGQLQQVEAAFVLSGNSMERIQTAAQIQTAMNLSPIICTLGEGVHPNLAALGLDHTDAEIARLGLIRLGVDSSAIRVIARGSSTYEESEEILGYSRTQGYDRIMVISSKFHTRRIHQVFTDKFREAGIEVSIIGAEPIGYSLDSWWENEDAMLFVFNEYTKMVYYWWKYE